MAYKYDCICLYCTSYLNLDPVDAWLLRYQSLEGCHFIWNTEMGRSPGKYVKLLLAFSHHLESYGQFPVFEVLTILINS
jgi:hypothetical protein